MAPTITKPRILVTLLIALGILGTGTIAIGAIAAHAARSPQVPLTGSYSGTATFTSATTVTFSGTGTSTLLGHSTNEGHIVVTGPDSSCPGGLANINNETLIAANGDSLMFSANDVACPVSPGVVHGTGQWVVTGGTGRFSGATGKGNIDGYGDFNQGVFSFQLIGTISTPKGG